MSRPSNRFQVIGLSGPKESGKDTIAQLLHTHCDFYPLAFADALRLEISAAYQIDPSILVTRETKEEPLPALALDRCTDDLFVARMIVAHQKRGQVFLMGEPRSPRTILTWWGTDYRRATDPKYWLRPVIERITGHYRAGTHNRFVISDVRFQNEAELVREYGGLLWQVKRPGYEPAVHAHVSETTGSMFSPDTVINNLHDVRHLQGQVLAAWWGHDAGLPVTVQVETPA